MKVEVEQEMPLEAHLHHLVRHLLLPVGAALMMPAPHRLPHRRWARQCRVLAVHARPSPRACPGVCQRDYHRLLSWERARQLAFQLSRQPLPHLCRHLK